jgi:hypothetical protein
MRKQLATGQAMDLSNYELVRYPSGQVTLCRAGVEVRNGVPQRAPGPMDVVGFFASEEEALRALRRLASEPQPRRKHDS